MKKITIYIVLILTVSIGIWFGIKDSSIPDISKNKRLLSPIASTYIIVKDTILTRLLHVSGSLLPQDEIAIAPEISGRIKRLFINEGSFVQKGSVLVKLDDAELQAQLSKVKALIDLAEINAKREKELLKGGGTSAELLERADNTVLTLQSDFQILKAAIAKTEIKAPFSGTIGLKEVSEGSFVSPGTKISYLVNSSPIRIECSIPEKYTSLVKKNMKIQFHVYGNEQSFEAKISAINPMIDPISRTTKIIALYANKKGECKPGAFADIEIPLSVEEKAIMIPNEAIVPDIRGLRVFLLKQGKAKPKPIEAGMRTAYSLEIIKGLNIGDTVLVAGASLMKAGSKVKAKPMYTK